MATLARRRGSSFVDAIVTLFILGLVGLVFSAIFPAGFSATRQAQEYKVANAIAQRKIEQLRAMRFESLSQPLLAAAGAIDPSDTISPYSFTATEGVAGQLASGTGDLTVVNDTPDVKRVRVTVTWKGARASRTRTVRLTTLFADRRTRKLN